MALGFLVALRNNLLDEITTLVDFDAAAGEIRLYTGTRPATGGAVTTLVATMKFQTTSAPAAAGGVWTANTPLVDDPSAVGGTTTWFRVVDGAGVFVFDGDVGTSGSDLNLNTTTVSAGVNVAVTSFVMTAGNP